MESAKGSLRSLGGRAADSLRSLPSRGFSAVVGAPSAPRRSTSSSVGAAGDEPPPRDGGVPVPPGDARHASNTAG